MALSEEEKRALEELEKSLYADDPKFVAKVARPTSAAKVVGGVLLAVIGISLMVFAAIAHLPVFGVLGFALMLVGVLLATPSRGVTNPPRASQQKPQPSNKPSSGKSFFEDRWDKRS